MKAKGRCSLPLVMVMTLALFGLGAMLNPTQAEAQKKLSFVFVNQSGPRGISVRGQAGHGRCGQGARRRCPDSVSREE